MIRHRYKIYLFKITCMKKKKITCMYRIAMRFMAVIVVLYVKAYEKKTYLASHSSLLYSQINLPESIDDG